MANGGKVEFSDLTKFRENLEKSLSDEQIQIFIESCAKELAARLLAKVIKRTPVGKKPELKGDKFVVAQGRSGKQKKFLSAEAARIQAYWGGYTGGTLRRGWTGGKTQNATEYAQSLHINRAGTSYVIEVVNPVEYAPYVEFGHRQQVGRYVPALGKRLKQGWVEGKFMLTISSEEIQRDAPKVLENKLAKKLGDIFK